jgi:hypothetical protein
MWYAYSIFATYSECYAPNINQDLYLNEASFVMAHDAATGYIHAKNNNNENITNDDIYSSGGYVAETWQSNDDATNYYQGGSTWNKISTGLLALYGKTQVGSVYQQLNDGARALDLRPKIYNNGTVGFHHGSLINIPLTSITLGGLLEDAKQWCNDNPKELVILFHHELTHEAGDNGLSSQVYTEIDDFYANEAVVTTDDAEQQDDANVNDYYDDDEQKSSYSYYYSGIAKLKDVYREHGIPYFSCDMLSGVTVGQAMQLADLSQLGGKGFLLAVDRHDMYGELFFLFRRMHQSHQTKSDES